MTHSLFGVRFGNARSAIFVAAVLAAWSVLSWEPARVPAAPPAVAREHNEQHDAAEHAKESAALQAAFEGHVDLYFDAAQLAAGKPGVSGAKFVDIVDVTGKALLRFERDNERWLIDPDAVIAFKVTKSK